MPRCFIGLGGNVGDVRATIGRALHELEYAQLLVVRCSRFYDTTPVGCVAGQRYLNAAAELEVDASPAKVLTALHRIEHREGRVRDQRWGPRTLDLDLLLCGVLVCHSAALTLPHPALWYRRFVLDPLVDVGADVVHPVFGQTISALRNRLLPRPLPVHLAGSATAAARLKGDLQPDFGWAVEWTSAPDQAAIIFSLEPGSPRLLPQTIDLATTSDPSALARDVLTAALDEPRPMVSV